MPIITRKVLAYITNGHRLLVFRQPAFPEAGIQVPGGTLDLDESPLDGVLREAAEETGLTALRVESLLGEHIRTVDDVTFHRHVFHLTCHGSPPESWEHYELFPSDGDPDPILFDFFWVPLPNGVPPMVAEMDWFISDLIEVLGFGRSTGERQPTNG